MVASFSFVMRWARRLCLLGAVVVASTGAVQACDGPGGCAVDGGLYHAESPSNASGPHPAVVFLHGWGGSGEGSLRNRRLVDAMLARGYAVIAPTGQPRGQGRNGYRWNAFGRDDLRDDVAFLDRVARDAVDRLNLDPDRLILGGFSGGGMMTWRVACDAPGLFAAYVPVAGLLWRPLPDDCAGPVRLLHTHGWIDTVVPIEGRSVAGGRFTQGDLFVGLDLLRRANACARDDPDVYDSIGRLLLRAWTECAPGSALAFALHPGGHETPSGWADMALDWVETPPAIE